MLFHVPVSADRKPEPPTVHVSLKGLTPASADRADSDALDAPLSRNRGKTQFFLVGKRNFLVDGRVPANLFMGFFQPPRFRPDWVLSTID